MATQIELNGYDYSDLEKKFKQTTLNYPEPDPTKAYAHGQPTTVKGARTLIKNYWELIKKEMGEEIAKKENIAFTFGKEALLSILSQEECVGIKFYIGNRLESECPIDFKGKWAGKTLVSIGIRNDTSETEIGADIDYIARGIVEGVASPNAAKAGDTQPGMICEMIPPFTMSDIKPIP
jgi:hypothetical protein